MNTGTEYIKEERLIDGAIYKINARNGYVGLWSRQKNGFLIVRYKMGSKPCLFYVHYWDACEQLGTVRPMSLIERSKYLVSDVASLSDSQKTQVTEYLEGIEETWSIVDGISTLQERRRSAISFQERFRSRSRQLPVSRSFAKNQGKLNRNVEDQ